MTTSTIRTAAAGAVVAVVSIGTAYAAGLAVGPPQPVPADFSSPGPTK